MNRRQWLFGSIAGMLMMTGVCLSAAELPEKTLARLAPHMVKVQYHLQYHHGEEPEAHGWMEQCSGCGRYHINSAATAVRQERPAELPGILLSPTAVLIPDPLVHSRFVEKITVVRQGVVRRARISGYAGEQSGLMLTLEEPMPETPGMVFDGTRRKPFYAVTYRDVNGRWLLRAEPLNTAPAITESGERFISVPAPSLIVDASGIPVTAGLQIHLPSASWKTAPGGWDWLSREQVGQRLQDISAVVESSVVRVMLNLRPPAEVGDALTRGSFGGDEEPTKMHVLGVLLRGGRLLVLAELTPRTTGRLERIRAFLPEEREIEARFVASLKDYGVLVAELDEVPSGAGIEMSGVGLERLRNQWLPSALVHVAGHRRVCWMDHVRIDDLSVGWRQQLIPEVREHSGKLFAFDPAGRLVLLPVSRRDRTAGGGSRFQSSSNNPIPTATAYLLPVLADLSSHSDVANRPLSGEETGRLAWMGVELQALTDEMAEMAGVTDQFSRYRRSGALVTYVYPDSPAAEADMQSGMIMMRLRLPGRSEPIPVNAPEYPFGGMAFPWEELEHVPPEYLDKIPKPWPVAANAFNRTLTDIGIGQDIIVEIFQDGRRQEKQFVIEQGPHHFDTAPRYVSETLGITVRDLTYELRHFFRRPEGEPGVVISRVVPGGRGATAGLLPYEIITHVNEVAVHNVSEWQKALEGRRELKMTIRRMSHGRVARITLPPAEAGGQ